MAPQGADMNDEVDMGNEVEVEEDNEVEESSNDGLLEYELKPGFSHFVKGVKQEAGTIVKMTEERFSHVRDRFRLQGPWNFLEDISEDDAAKFIEALDSVEDITQILEIEEKGPGRLRVINAARKKLLD